MKQTTFSPAAKVCEATTKKTRPALSRVFAALLALTMLLCLPVSLLHAQYRACGTTITAEKAQLSKNIPLLPLPGNAPGQNKPTSVDLKIQFHVVCSGGGASTAVATSTQISQALTFLNTKFNAAGINFVQCSGIDYILNSQYATSDFPFADHYQEMLLGGHDRLNAINVYLLSTIHGIPGTNLGSFGGYTYFLNATNRIFLATKDFLGDPLGIENGTALTHEMGHFFGAHHTNGDYNQLGHTDELVNGSNSLTTADFLQDTPADPATIQYLCSSSNGPCTYPCGVPANPCPPNTVPAPFCDANGQKYQPLGNNLMFPEYCQSFNAFTTGQLQKIYSTYQAYFQNKFNGNFNLITRDNYEDAGYEPGENPYTVWQSPWIWNCRSGGTCTTHENPGYSDPTKNNYLRIQVQNNGCASSPAATLHAYWTLGSTGETWPAAWNGAQICGLPAGDEIKYNGASGQAIPVLTSGQATTLTFPWKPIDPTQGYNCVNPLEPYTDGDPMICFLSRIESSQDPMFSEQAGVISHNIIYNNNIATTNTSLKNLPGSKPGRDNGAGGTALVQNPYEAAAGLDLHITATDNTPTGFMSLGTATIRLSDELWAAWVSGGRTGRGISLYDEGEHRIQITTADAALTNVHLAASQTYGIAMLFFLNTATDSKVQTAFTLYQTRSDAPETLAGSACVWQVAVNGADAMARRISPAAVAADNASFYPNPAGDMGTVRFSLAHSSSVTAEITDITGRKVLTLMKDESYDTGTYELPVSLSSFAAGSYILQVKTATGLQSVKIIVQH